MKLSFQRYNNNKGENVKQGPTVLGVLDVDIFELLQDVQLPVLKFTIVSCSSNLVPVILLVTFREFSHFDTIHNTT